MANPAAPLKTGNIPFTYEGEAYSTYYVVFGDLENRTRDPLVVVHGGPGLVHNYLLPFSDIAVTTNTPVILYDQIGNGRSTHLRDKSREFWQIPLWVDELANLLAYFHIEDSFNLVGHSWGGILGAEFTVRRKPKGLKKLVLSNSLASTALWNQSNAQLMQKFPEWVQEGLRGGMKDPARYKVALEAYHAVHGVAVVPTPEEVAYTMGQVFWEEGDPTVGNAPVLKDWTIVDRLDQIHVPTLIINGRQDISQDFVIAPFWAKIPKAKWLTFEKSSHQPFWEERELYFRRIADFLELEV